MKDHLIIRKNILDIDLQKYLQVASVSIIILFTYVIGIAISFLTHQINLSSFVDMGILGIISSLVFGLGGFFFINALMKIEKITIAIKNMEKLVRFKTI